MRHLFWSGVHPDGRKELSRGAPLSPAPLPAQVVIPMLQHIGKPCTPLVKPGDTVRLGQKIGDAEGLSATVHASVSGRVLAVEPRPHPSGRPVLSAVLENDGLDTPDRTLVPHETLEGLSPDDLLTIIREAGIVGMGGATFPTDIKAVSAAGRVDTVLLNACECEPYITADDALLCSAPERVLRGASVLRAILQPDRVVLAVEDNKTQAIESVRRCLEQYPGIELAVLPTRYPQGAEKQLIQRITGRQVPPGGLPADVKVTVFNVATASAIYDAVTEGKPLTHRNVTLTGGAMARPLNVNAPIGTPIEHLVKMAGGFQTQPQRLLMGGPMMGNPQYDLTAPMMKGTNCILALTDAEAAIQDTEQTCIRCGKCVNACPMHLMPLYMRLFSTKRDWEKVESYNVMDCIECGSCNYICPARIHLVQTFRMAKFEIRGLQAKQKAKEAANA